MPQEVFGKAVKRVLPSAIPTHLERIDEYAVGKVLVYSKPPRKLFPLRKQAMDFTGYSLESLLAEEEKLTITTARSYLFDTEKSTFTKTVKLDIGGDFDLETALLKLASADSKFKFKAGENKTLTITTDFGQITHISTDLVNSTTSGKIQVQPDHPIVKKAIHNGGVMFVISTIYEGQHCKVGVTASKETSESGGVGVGVAKDQAEGSEDADDKHHSSKVVSRDQPTPLAYLLLKVSVNAKGVVTTQLNTRLSDKVQISHPYPAPLSEIATAKITPPLQSAKQTAAKETAATEPVTITAKPDESDGMPDEHYLYSLKDFQPFQSTTYFGILDEAKNWVRPFVSNTKLQEAFLTYTKPPRTYERLNDLSAYFLDMGNALRSGGPAPTDKPKDVDIILKVLSEDEEVRMNECSSVIVVSEAADEFPQHILRKIVELPSEKKKVLKDLILGTPYAHSRHVFVDEGPFPDPDLKPIMQRMGFSIPLGTHNLLHSRSESDEEEDKLSAALILLLALEKV